jgi:hypothetical protein
VASRSSAQDVKLPKNKIIYPRNGKDVPYSIISVTGAAKDNAGVVSVWYRLNAGEWKMAASYDNWTNWTALNLDLLPGQNTVQAFALDAAGNVSATNTVKFNSTPYGGNWAGVCKTGLGEVAVRMSLTQTGDRVTGYLFQDGSLVGAGTLSVALVDGVISTVKWPPFYPDKHKQVLTIHSSQGQVWFTLTINRNGITGAEYGVFEGSIKLHRN